MSSKISVLVPVHNAEKTLRRCLTSILAQTMADLEIIVIDDGSTDHSKQIILDYAGKDSRIRAFSQSNQGIAATRQRGIDLATGDWIAHVDADDWIDKDYLQSLLLSAEENKSEMVICDYIEHGITEDRLFSQKLPTTDPEQLLGLMFTSLHGGLWNKLIKRSAILKYNIQFVKGINCNEDQLFVMSLLHCGIKVSYCERIAYHYDKTSPSSITNNWLDIPMTQRVQFLDNLAPMISEANQLYFNNRVAYFAYDALFCKEEFCPDYSGLFGKYADRIKKSTLPATKKAMIRLRLSGIKIPVRSLRAILDKIR